MKFAELGPGLTRISALFITGLTILSLSVTRVAPAQEIEDSSADESES